jgi:hypothetical protein
VAEAKLAGATSASAGGSPGASGRGPSAAVRRWNSLPVIVPVRWI